MTDRRRPRRCRATPEIRRRSLSLSGFSSAATLRNRGVRLRATEGPHAEAIGALGNYLLEAHHSDTVIALPAVPPATTCRLVPTVARLPWPRAAASCEMGRTVQVRRGSLALPAAQDRSSDWAGIAKMHRRLEQLTGLPAVRLNCLTHVTEALATATPTWSKSPSPAGSTRSWVP